MNNNWSLSILFLGCYASAVIAVPITLAMGFGLAEIVLLLLCVLVIPTAFALALRQPDDRASHSEAPWMGSGNARQPKTETPSTLRRTAGHPKPQRTLRTKLLLVGFFLPILSLWGGYISAVSIYDPYVPQSGLPAFCISVLIVCIGVCAGGIVIVHVASDYFFADQ